MAQLMRGYKNSFLAHKKLHYTIAAWYQVLKLRIIRFTLHVPKMTKNIINRFWGRESHFTIYAIKITSVLSGYDFKN